MYPILCMLALLANIHFPYELSRESRELLVDPAD